MHRRFLPLLVAVAASIACRETPEAPPAASFDHVPVVAFDAVFRPIARVPLRVPDGDPIGNAAALDVTGDQVTIADVVQANVKVFDRRTGALVRTLGRAGDGPGEFRNPAGLARTPAGDLVVFDFQRSVVSWWDTMGQFRREATVPGFWSSMIGVPGTDRVLLLGYYYGVAGDTANRMAARPVLHEYAPYGQVVASYRTFTRPTHPLQQSFSTFTAAVLDPVVVSGTYSDNLVYLRNRLSGREWQAQIGAPWYHRPDWNTKLPTGRGAVAAVNKWVQQQTLAYQLYALDHATFVAQFQSYGQEGDRRWGYVIADTTGVSQVATRPHAVQILRIAGDTAWGVEPDAANGETVLGSFLVARPSATAAR